MKSTASVSLELSSNQKIAEKLGLEIETKFPMWDEWFTSFYNGKCDGLNDEFIKLAIKLTRVEAKIIALKFCLNKNY